MQGAVGCPVAFADGSAVLPVATAESKLEMLAARADVTWATTTPVARSTGSGLSLFGAADAHTAWFLDGVHLYTTADGGRTWQVRAPPDLSDAQQIDVVTASLGYVLLKGPRNGIADVARTMDGGRTWQDLPLVLAAP